MTDITAALREARKDLLDLGMTDKDPEVHAINVCILEREASPLADIRDNEPLPRHETSSDHTGHSEEECKVEDVRAMVVQEWHKIVKEHGLKPGSTCETLVGRLLRRIDGI